MLLPNDRMNLHKLPALDSVSILSVVKGGAHCTITQLFIMLTPTKIKKMKRTSLPDLFRASFVSVWYYRRCNVYTTTDSDWLVRFLSVVDFGYFPCILGKLEASLTQTKQNKTKQNEKTRTTTTELERKRRSRRRRSFFLLQKPYRFVCCRGNWCFENGMCP